MPVQVRYCNQCGIKISPREIEKKTAVEFKGTCYCKDCFAGMPPKVREKLQNVMDQQEKLGKSKKTSEESSFYLPMESGSAVFSGRLKGQDHLPSKKTSGSLRSKNFSEGEKISGKKNSSSLWVGLVLGALALLLVGFYFLSPSSPPEKKPLNPGNGLTTSPPKKIEKTWKDRYKEVLAYQKKNPDDYRKLEREFRRLWQEGPTQELKDEVEEKLGHLKALENRKKNPPIKKDPPSTGPSEEKYIGSSRKFHRPDCTGVKRIAKRNLKIYKSRQEAIKDGKSPCKNCKP